MKEHVFGSRVLRSTTATGVVPDSRPRDTSHVEERLRLARWSQNPNDSSTPFKLTLHVHSNLHAGLASTIFLTPCSFFSIRKHSVYLLYTIIYQQNRPESQEICPIPLNHVNKSTETLQAPWYLRKTRRIKRERWLQDSGVKRSLDSVKCLEWPTNRRPRKSRTRIRLLRSTGECSLFPHLRRHAPS